MSVDLLWLLDCPDCGGERWFEAPACADGHGAACPERACVECGAAALIGGFAVAAPPATTAPFASARRELRGAA